MDNIYNYTLHDLEEYFTNMSIKPYVAKQIYEQLYKSKITNPKDMQYISKKVINDLQKNFTFSTLVLAQKQEDKLVKKYLFSLSDNQTIESVLMYHDYGRSLCISSQVGCNMGCAFCQSGKLKKVRNLAPHEMVEQVLYIEKDIGEKISHVVIMGIGEPFDNYDNVMKFIKIINTPQGINIGSRHITISTCGIVPKIKQFTEENTQINLAISLHASNDKIRNELMPINKVYNLSKLIASIKEYIKATNRRVTFEYIMLKDVNDNSTYAHELARLLKNINCYVNLIPYNQTENNLFFRSENNKIMKFYDILKKEKINVTIRKEFGSKVNAACGQLRANNLQGG